MSKKLKIALGVLAVIIVFCLWYTAVDGHTECQISLNRIQHIKLNVMTSRIRKKTNRHPQSIFPDKTGTRQSLILLGSHIVEITV